MGADGDGHLTAKEFEQMMEAARFEFPQIEAYLGHVCNESLSIMYKQLDAVDAEDRSGATFEIFEKACAEVDKELKMLPPTAQVAAQQGEYLAKIINAVELKDLGHREGFSPPFEYNHAGSMAYVGDESAVIDS